jgi:hypothetical protein
MHEFCCCEALKVFKIIYKKIVKRCKRFDLRRFENLFEKKKNQTLSFSPSFQPSPAAHSPPSFSYFFHRWPTSLHPFLSFSCAARFPFRPTRPSPASSLPLSLTDKRAPPVSFTTYLRPPPSFSMAAPRRPSPAPPRPPAPFPLPTECGTQCAAHSHAPPRRLPSQNGCSTDPPRHQWQPAIAPVPPPPRRLPFLSSGL